MRLNYKIFRGSIATILFIGINIGAISAQFLNRKLGEFIIQLHPNSTVQYALSDIGIPGHTAVPFKSSVISQDLNIFHIKIDYAQYNELDYLAALKRHGSIAFAQFNHIGKKRDKIPNDNQWNRMWHLRNIGQNTGSTFDADIDAEQAWDIATGGNTALGDTIVIAVIDAGTDLNHYDLKPGLWINHNEIPNNNIDDDNNGYNDDYYGYNADLQNGNVQFTNVLDGDHGININAIIGAKGNNSTGMVGVSWNVKIMTVREDSEEEAVILRAYEYVRKNRQQYNETNGKKGAFVVASNTSFGLDNTFEQDVPVWCAFYNALGQVGILNIGATSNDDINVDEEGDIPSLCSSNHLVAVTATDWDDIRTFAAYGPINVDLGAPGEDIVTLHRNNQYLATSGTSFACPMVVGAIGLMYSVNNIHFARLAKSNPEAASLEARRIILESVDKKSNLFNEVATGGRLNLFNALKRTAEFKGDCVASCQAQGNTVRFNLDSIYAFSEAISMRSDSTNFSYKADIFPNANEATNYNYKIVLPKTPDTIAKQHLAIWVDLNKDGAFNNSEEKVVKKTLQNTSSTTGSIAIPWNISAGASRVRVILKPYTSLDSIAPEPCDSFAKGSVVDFCVNLVKRVCPGPDSLSVVNVGQSQATLRWNMVMDGIAYVFRHRELGTNEWKTMADTMKMFTIIDLDPCTNYEFQVKTICAFDTSRFSNSRIFKTNGPGCSNSANDIDANSAISMYPNPFSNELYLQFRGNSQLKNYSLQVINSDGKQIYYQHQSQYLNQLDIIPLGDVFRPMLQGVYIIRLQDEKGNRYNSRVIKL